VRRWVVEIVWCVVWRSVDQRGACMHASASAHACAEFVYRDGVTDRAQSVTGRGEDAYARKHAALGSTRTCVATA
jgi:hypothetical protein